MYHFTTIEALRKAVYKKADSFHTSYLMEHCKTSATPLLEIGLRYIRFAATEQHLFRFLYQVGAFSGKSILDLMEAEELEPILAILQQKPGMDREEAKNIFCSLFLTAHGCASLLANHAMKYDENTITKRLNLALWLWAHCKPFERRRGFLHAAANLLRIRYWLSVYDSFLQGEKPDSLHRCPQPRQCSQRLSADPSREFVLFTAAFLTIVSLSYAL